MLGLRDAVNRIKSSVQQAWNTTRPTTLGQQGEDAAADFLRRRGYKIVARQVRDGLGELDLVAVDGQTVVFVEVKTRSSHDAGHPLEAVDDLKQRQLTRLALAYLKRHHLLENAARFDVVAITWKKSQAPEIQHVPNAFEPKGQWQLFN